jgi:UDP-N-acetylglucosamine transferase subunit ALG13
MIFILFGTNPYEFHRLAKAVEELAEKTTEKIVVQLGNTTYKLKGTESFDFVPRKRINELIAESSLVISQGGFGSMIDAIRAHKPLVAVPRGPDEAKDGGSGQIELVRKFESLGYLIGVYDIEDLAESVSRARNHTQRSPPESTIPEIVHQFVDEVCG